MIEGRKTTINGVTYEIVPAEVDFVDYSGTNKEKLYTVRCHLLYAFGSQSPSDTITARPIDYNIKRIPIAGEIISLMIGPSAYGSAIKQAAEYYYLPFTYPLHGLLNHNALPGKHDITTDDADTKNKSYGESQDGHAEKTGNDSGHKIEEIFPERFTMPLQPYSGDILIEGRFGGSVRFGSTLKDTNSSFFREPSWKKGTSIEGDPITIIRNGIGGASDTESVFGIENIDLDDSSIYLTSGQEVPFTLASTVISSLKNQENNSFDTDSQKYSGKQVLISSGRILLNARDREALVVAKKGIALATDKSVSIDAGSVIEAESARINLGLNATHPALLGDVAIAWLEDLVDQLSNLCSELITETHPTGFGPSGPPLNASKYANIKIALAKLKKKLPELKSELVFLNKQSGGYTPEEREYAEYREQGGTDDSTEHIRKNRAIPNNTDRDVPLTE